MVSERAERVATAQKGNRADMIKIAKFGVSESDFERAIRVIYDAFSDGDRILEISELEATVRASNVAMTNILGGENIDK